MSHVQSIRFGAKEMESIRKAAQLLDTSVNALVAQFAAEGAQKIILKHKKRCPHCGAARTT